MANRQTKYTAYTSTYIVVLVAILAGANFLANRYNKSIDTTANKRYSLSEQTEKIVKGLAGEVKITVVDKTERFNGARDLLDRYTNLSTKLKVNYLDPEKSPQEARAIGARSFGQVFVENGPKREEARALTEEELTGAIVRSLKTGDRTVCVIAGSGERGLDEMAGNGLSDAKTALERNNYKTRTIKLLEKPEVPADCTIAVVAGPRFDYIEPAVAALKTYVEKGGKALFLLAPPLVTGKEDTAANQKLVDLLGSWGIAVASDVVVDTSGIGRFFGYNEFVPLVATYEQHPIVRDLRDVATAFPLSRTVEPKDGGKAPAQRLLVTSEKSFASNTMDLAKLKNGPTEDRKGPLSLAAAVNWDKSRVVVFGSAEWATNSFLRFNGNRDLFLNVMDWLSADEELISIRPKDPDDRRLNVQPGQAWLFSFTAFAPALAVIAAGVMVWLKRR